MIYSDFEFVPGIAPGAILKWRENVYDCGNIYPVHDTLPGCERPSALTVTRFGVVTEVTHEEEDECSCCGSYTTSGPYLKVQLIDDKDVVYDFDEEWFEVIDLVTDPAQVRL